MAEAAERVRRAAIVVMLTTVAGCSTDDNILPLELTPVIACTEAASDPEVAGERGTAELVRSERTTEGGLSQWLATRHGPDGPSHTVAPSGAPESLVDVCVYRTTAPRQISMPEGSTADTTGVRVLVRFGDVTVEAVGNPDQLAKALDTLSAQSH